jgi:dTDP-4-dehydrorhamnose reductase
MRVAVTGAGGMLAREVLREAARRGHVALAFPRAQLDVTDEAAVAAALRAAAPDVVVQCAAYTRVDDAEHEEAEAARVNAEATAFVARVCAGIGARLVYPSTDYVFDGTARVPYPPDAPTSPINAYGRSKLAGEHAALGGADALVVRTSWLHGPGGRNFVRTILARARTGAPLRVVNDQVGSPTSTLDLAAMIFGLVEGGAPAGIHHATNRGDTTWYGLACAALELAGIDAAIQPCSSGEFPQVARRPQYSVLDCAATYAITGPAPAWEDGLAAALREETAAG